MSVQVVNTERKLFVCVFCFVCLELTVNGSIYENKTKNDDNI